MHVKAEPPEAGKTEEKRHKIALFPGDGIGNEIIREALKVLDVIAEQSGVAFDVEEGLIGGAAYDRYGLPLPEESLEIARRSEAVLLGAVGGAKWDALDYRLRPEMAVLSLRKELDLFAKVRRVVAFEELIDASPLKHHLVKDLDIMIIRELTGGAYFGKPRGIRIEDGQRVGVDTIVYTEEEIRRVAVVAFEAAGRRIKSLVSVDQANILESGKLWRDVITEVSRDYPDIDLQHMYAGECAVQLILHPAQFDVIVTSDMFGDILSEEASILTGCMNMLPSASLGMDRAMYEPSQSPAVELTGRNIANPLAAVLSVAMMLRLSFSMIPEADAIKGAVTAVLKNSFRTRDIYQEGAILVTTEEMGNEVVKKLKDKGKI